MERLFRHYANSAKAHCHLACVALPSLISKHSPRAENIFHRRVKHVHLILVSHYITCSLCLRSNSLAVVSLRTVRIAIATMAVPNPITDVLREIEVRYEWEPVVSKVFLDRKGVHVRKVSDFTHAFDDEKDPSIATIVLAASFIDSSAFGHVSKLRQAIIALKKAEAETESLKAQGGRDRP